MINKITNNIDKENIKMEKEKKMYIQLKQN